MLVRWTAFSRCFITSECLRCLALITILIWIARSGSRSTEALSLDQLGDALYAATVWEFEPARKAILTDMPTDMPYMKRIMLGIKCGVPAWLISGLEELCGRREPLCDSEIEIIGYPRAAAVGRVREWLATSGATDFPRSSTAVRYCMCREPGIWELQPQMRMNGPVRTCGLKRHGSFYMHDWDLLTFKVRVFYHLSWPCQN